MRLETRKAWLEATCLLIAASGVLLMLGASPALQEGARIFADLAFWPMEGARSLAAPESRLLAAVSGGLTVGFCLMAWAVSRALMLKAPETARRIILTGVAGWIPVDSLGSMLAGAPFNVALNVIVAALFIAPLSGRLQ